MRLRARWKKNKINNKRNQWESGCTAEVRMKLSGRAGRYLENTENNAKQGKTIIYLKQTNSQRVNPAQFVLKMYWL